jgi:glycosyltransferase involved in cell wall biosynthesis
MPLRIAHVISTRGMGGAERFLASLVVAGAERGLEQVVLNPFATKAVEALRELCHPVACAGRRCDGLTELPALRRWLRQELTAFRPDIVHVLLFQASAVTATLPSGAAPRRLLTKVYGGLGHVTRGRKLVEVVDKWVDRKSDHIVAISEAVREGLVGGYGIPSADVTCIPLGWKGDPLPRPLPHSAPTVICVAALRPEKGHDVLLDAFAHVRREIPDARLVLVGQGEMRPALEAQAAAAGLAGSVEFRGAVPEIWPSLAEADVFALASRVEAFGIAIAEAMAAGLPVVAPAVGAIPELVQPGVTGELFPAGDHVALAGHLVRLLQSDDLRSRMSTAARGAAEPLRVENAIERYFGVYEAMVEAPANDRRLV